MEGRRIEERKMRLEEVGDGRKERERKRDGEGEVRESRMEKGEHRRE